MCNINHLYRHKYRQKQEHLCTATSVKTQRDHCISNKSVKQRQFKMSVQESLTSCKCLCKMSLVTRWPLMEYPFLQGQPSYTRKKLGTARSPQHYRTSRCFQNTTSNYTKNCEMYSEARSTGKHSAVVMTPWTAMKTIRGMTVHQLQGYAKRTKQKVHQT